MQQAKKSIDYNEIYKRVDYGCPYPSKGLRFAAYYSTELASNSKVLCVGCGNAWEVTYLRKFGLEAYGVDIVLPNVEYLKGKLVKAEVPYLPFRDNTFDLVACCETLEHIPEETTNDFITECRRVGEKSFFSVATEPDKFDTHINVHTPVWWLNKLEEINYELQEFRFRPSVTLLLAKNFLFRMKFPEGIMFFGS